MGPIWGPGAPGPLQGKAATPTGVFWAHFLTKIDTKWHTLTQILTQIDTNWHKLGEKKGTGARESFQYYSSKETNENTYMFKHIYTKMRN